MTQVQVSRTHYFTGYDTKPRFACYWHQIDEILSVNAANILEVGVGTGLLRDYLKRHSIPVCSIDIDESLRPDITASVTDLPFTSDHFDVSVCFQVLEHLPYERFTEALAELARVSSRYVIISLPDRERTCRFMIDIPKIVSKTVLMDIPRWSRRIHKFDGQHHWEINKKGYELRGVSDKIRSAGLEIVKTFRVFESPYHRFFVLSCE